jgi:hypothetical protein
MRVILRGLLTFVFVRSPTKELDLPKRGDATRCGLHGRFLLPASDASENDVVGRMDRSSGTNYCRALQLGRGVSFQITILKVLAGNPDGRASIAELTRYVSILMSSGPDWADRMRRLTARAPKFEIFADGFVLREARGWCITDTGRRFLASLEAPIPASTEEQTVASPPSQAPPTLRLVVDNTLGSRRGLDPDERRTA